MKKVICTILAALMLCMLMVGCGSGGGINLDKNETLGELTFVAPSAWEESATENSYIYTKDEYTVGIRQLEDVDMAQVDTQDSKAMQKNMENWYRSAMDLNKTGYNSIDGLNKDDFNGKPAQRYHYSGRVSGQTYEINALIFATEWNVYLIYTMAPEKKGSALNSAFNEILDSIKIDEIDMVKQGLLTGDELVKYVQDNNMYGVYNSGAFESNQCIAFTGIVSELDIGYSSRNFIFNEEIDGEIQGKRMSIDRDSEGEKLAAKGAAITVYGYVDNFGKFEAKVVQEAEVSFTYDEIVQQYYNKCVPYDYHEAASNSSAYRGTDVRVTGTVYFIVSGSEAIIYVGSYTNSVVIRYSSSVMDGKNLVDGDRVTVYGEAAGMSSVFNDPMVDARYIIVS